jgi:alanine racemase
MRSVDRPIVTIELSRVRANVQEISKRTGVPVIAVVKADAYGLGARKVVEAIADLVESFYVFDAAETLLYEEVAAGKPTIALVGASNDASDYVSRNIRPAVWNAGRAIALRAARPVLSVDTGQQRFACPANEVEHVLNTRACDEAFTHATTPAQVKLLHETAGGKVAKLHAAGSALIEDPSTWLDAVRPGLALYHNAVRVAAPLLEAKDANGPAGYGGFVSSTGRLGVFAAGYSNGMRAGATCFVNGERRPVREVGMQSTFIELGPRDKAGDEVILLGNGITTREIATAWGTSQQEALFRLAGIGERRYAKP